MPDETASVLPRVRQYAIPGEDIESRTEEDGSKVHRVTIFRNQKARSGPELVLKGLSLVNYIRNPTVQWAHDTVGRTGSGGLPIAKSLKLDKTDDRIVADFTFLQGDPFAQRVENAWDQGFIRAASVSWLPKETEQVDGETDEYGFGMWRDTKSELLEWSLVPVPADPGALREAYLRALAADLEIDLKDIRTSSVSKGTAGLLDLTSIAKGLKDLKAALRGEPNA